MLHRHISAPQGRGLHEHSPSAVTPMCPWGQGRLAMVHTRSCYLLQKGGEAQVSAPASNLKLTGLALWSCGIRLAKRPQWGSRTQWAELVMPACSPVDREQGLALPAVQEA